MMNPLLKDEELDDKTPYVVPFTNDFEEAFIWLQNPLKALANGIFEASMESRGKSSDTLCQIANTISVFLDQLNYLINHSYIDGKSVVFAEIQHPFTITPNPKTKTEASNEN